MSAGSVDEIWIATGPEITRVMFLAGDVVVEIWHDFAAAPSRIAEVHRLKIDQVFAGQNRATARLEDGTPVSLRLTPRDRPQPGQRITATIIGAPRQDKPWQGVVGARLVGAHVVLLPGDQGLYASRALPDASFEPLSASLAEKLPPGFGAILRRGVAGQDAFVVADELMMLVQLWHDRMQANGRLHDGGTLAQKAALHAPGANMCIEGDALPTGAPLNEHVKTLTEQMKLASALLLAARKQQLLRSRESFNQHQIETHLAASQSLRFNVQRQDEARYDCDSRR